MDETVSDLGAGRGSLYEIDPEYINAVQGFDHDKWL